MKNIYANRTVGSVLLVAGTQIGAGMLALPITTARGGYFFSVLLFLVSFLYMLLTLYLLMEANLYEESYEANIISMAKKRLGTFGQFVAWFSFLLLLYSVAAAYISAGGSLVAKLLHDSFSFAQDTHWGVTLFIILFACVVFLGPFVVDYVNRFLMFGLILSYLLMVIFITPHLRLSNFSLGEPIYLLAAVPVVVLSFTSHIIVPSLRTYLQNDVSKLKKALWYGSLIPLIFYLIWETLILGVVPAHGTSSLANIADAAHPVAKLTDMLHASTGLAWIAIAVGSFSFFALVTSFLGVALALMDFLADGFQIKKNLSGRVILLLATIVPPLLFALFSPSGFVLALSYAGVFVAILYGILPVIMVWKARYIERLPATYRVTGGRPVLVLSVICSILVILFQVGATLHWLR